MAKSALPKALRNAAKRHGKPFKCAAIGMPREVIIPRHIEMRVVDAKGKAVLRLRPEQPHRVQLAEAINRIGGTYAKKAA